MPPVEKQPGAQSDELTQLRDELQSLRAANEQLLKEHHQAIGMLNSLRSDMEEQRRLMSLRTMKDRVEDARQAQQISADVIAKQSLGRNSGKYGWRISIKGYKQPIIMWCDESETQNAIAAFNNRFGTQFDGRKMSIASIGQPKETAAA